jgi:hypothetical protein
MFARRIPRPGKRPSVPARASNAPLALLEQLQRMRGGQGTTWTPAGPLIWQPGISFRLGQTGSGGIPAASGSQLTGAEVSSCSLTVDPQNPLSAQIQTWSDQFIAWNLSSQPVAGQTLTLYQLLWGMWVCVWENCPAS